MEMSLLITARCNAACAHCSTNCGPYRTESLSRETIFNLMDQAAALSRPEPPKVYLSGGEPFLDFGLLLEILAHGRLLGAVITCVTNGYWATSGEKARSTIQAVKDAGLRELAVSSSRFHEAFVSRKRIGRVLTAAGEVGLRCTLKHVRGRSDYGPRQSVSSWARATGASRVQEIPLLPHLRAGASLPESDYARRRGLPRGKCPARLLSINEDGNAYTCCTPGGFTEFLRLGSVHEESLKDLNERFYLGGTQQLMRERGPIYFARALQARGLGGRLRDSYGGVCDLCTHIATDPDLCAAAAKTSEAFEISQVEKILSAVVEEGPPRVDARSGRLKQNRRRAQ